MLPSGFLGRPSLVRAGLATAFLPALSIFAVAELPDEPGPWAVGIQTFIAADPAETHHDVTVEAFYPVDAEHATGVKRTYDIGEVLGAPGYLFEAPMGLDQPPVSLHGPFPVVIYSHGNFGHRLEALVTLELLASHGFIALSVDHPGNTFADQQNGTVAPAQRTQDVRMLLDAIELKNQSPHDAFRNRFALNRIGMTGWSLGANTALRLVGGSDTVPIDDRIKAILPVASVLPGLSDESLARIEVPVLVLGGVLDYTAPIENSVELFDKLGSELVYRVDLINGGHGSMSQTECLYADALLQQGAPAWLVEEYRTRECFDPAYIPIEEGQRLTAMYSVSFFKTHLADETGFESFLTPCYADEYEDEVAYLVRGDYAPAVVGDSDSISLSAGGAHMLSLCAGPSHAGREYRVLGSFAGTTPGIFISGVHVPLNSDDYLIQTMRDPFFTPLVGGVGVLDGEGRAFVAYHAPANSDPSLAGLSIHHAFIALSDTASSAMFASNSATLTFVP